MLNSSIPWLVGGDFNETVYPSEQSDNQSNYISAPMRDFKACLDQLELRDMRYHGLLFT